MKAPSLHASNRIVSLLPTGLLLSLWSCSSSVPSYSIAQLLAPATAMGLAAQQPPAFERTTLCQGFGTEWDSVLVLKPYMREELVQALPVANYEAIREQVIGQRISEASCTLLFVKAGRYQAYSIVPRTIDWSDLAKPGPNELVWLGQRDCSCLSMTRKPNATLADTITRYAIQLAPVAAK